MKLPAWLAAPWSPLPPFLMLIWLRTLDQHMHLNPHTSAPREVLGQRIEDAIMACCNNNLSLGWLSQRITFKLGPVWAVYIKVKCGAAEGKDRLETEEKEDIVKMVWWRRNMRKWMKHSEEKLQWWWGRWRGEGRGDGESRFVFSHCQNKTRIDESVCNA